MSIFHAISVLWLSLPLLLAIDYFKRKRGGEYDINHRGPDNLVLLTPFVLLFYTDQFWHNLLVYLIPLYVYYALVFFIAKIMRWYQVMWSILAFHSFGALLLTVIGYFLFFHEGPAAIAAEVQEQSAGKESSLMSYWAYFLAGFLALATLGLDLGKKSGVAATLILLLTGLFPILPFFMPNYWLGLGILSAVYVTLCLSLASRAGTASGAYAAFVYFYMLVATGSIVVRAIFF